MEGFESVDINLLELTFLGTSIRSKTLLRANCNRSETQDDSVNSVNALQQKFANGELTEDEFEQKLDRIVESQDIAEQIDDESLNVLEET